MQTLQGSGHRPEQSQDTGVHSASLSGSLTLRWPGDWAMWTGWPRLVLLDQQEAVGVAAGPVGGHGRGCAGGRDTIP